MSIEITPITLGFPPETATTLSIVFTNIDVVEDISATTTSNIYVRTISGNIIGNSSLPIPANIFSAYTNNTDSSGITTVENYVLTQFNLTRL